MNKLLASLLFGGLLIQSAFAQKNQTIMTNFDFVKSWKQVEEFEKKGLPESALKEVNAIYDQAKKINHTGHLVKAIIHQMKFMDHKEEDGFIRNLERLKSEIDVAVFPVKPLLQSMLAEMYWRYYQFNRSRFIHRTHTSAAVNDDLQTWDLLRIVQETIQLYNASLSFEEQSKATPLEIYGEVLHKGNEKGRQYQPTLYDFLAHRALKFYTNEEPSLTRPADIFSIDQETFLSDAQAFASLKFQTTDTLSFHFHALRLYQNLIAFHLNDEDPAALVEVDLKRLGFVRSHHILANKNELYLKALEALEKRSIAHPVSTRVTYQIALQHVENGGRYKPLQGDQHKWDLKRAFEIAQEGITRFPNSEGSVQLEALQTSIQIKKIAAVLEKNNEPDVAFRCLVTYANITEMSYRVIRVTRDEILAQRKKWERNYNVDREQKFIAYFIDKPAIKSGKFVLPDDGDFQEHKLEVKIDALPVGEYMVLFSNQPDFSSSTNAFAYAFTTVTKIAFVHRGMADGSTEVYTLNRKTGEPLKNVTVDLIHNRYDNKSGSYIPEKIGSHQSDASGFVRIPFMPKDTRRSFYINFSTADDFNSTEDIGQPYYYGHGSINQYKKEKRAMDTRTFFFLDRAIYRPGQTIYFKGLVVHTDGKTSQIQTDYKTTVRLYDVNGQEQGMIAVRTNEYGTFHGALIAPSSGLAGQMHIATEDGSGDIYFAVEEYKRPKFEVVFEPVQGTFKLGDSVRMTGKAIAFSGAQIDGAKVQYRVVREARFPFWWWCRWGYYPTSPAVAITHGVSDTDADGNFSISFIAIPDKTVDPASDPVFDYTIHADVTDINGETRSSVTTVSVGYKALLLNATVRALNKDSIKQASFPIVATNLAGHAERTQGTITIHALKAPDRPLRERLWERPDRQLYSREEYYSLFPHDQFANENNKLGWERGRQMLSVKFDTGNDKELTLPNLNSWNNGEYILEITAIDRYGNSVREVAYFSVYSTSARTIPNPAVHYYQPIKTTAQPGEKARFSTGTAAGKIHVLYEIEQDGRLLSKEWITLNNQQRVFEIPIREEHRGNISVIYTFVKDNRLYTHNRVINVPFTNKELDISFQAFRSKLQPGEKEQWKMLIKGKTAERVTAEMVATLYDASLDAFVLHNWYANFYNAASQRLHWQSQNGFDTKDFSIHRLNWNPTPKRHLSGTSFYELNWFGYSFFRFAETGALLRGRVAGVASRAKLSETEREEEDVDILMSAEAPQESAPPSLQDSAATQTRKKQDFSNVKVRSNFNETAFFYPGLLTNEQGEIIISFTVPEALTRWKMLGFAHTPDLKSGMVTNELVTQKDLMVVPNAPRFFRDGDTMVFSTKITSLADNALTGQARLEFFDALTMNPVVLLIDGQPEIDFSLKPKQSTSVSWNLRIPEGLQAVMYRVVAKAGSFSDGEEMVIPVVTNRMMVTESLPLSVRGGQTKQFRFEKLLGTRSTTLTHQRYTLEFTSNPAWYAIQALPYLMEYPYDCVEQIFSRYYANSIASHIANSNPRIKQVFDTWKNIQPDALLSNLEKNQELKSALLEETPWVLHAQDETQRKRMVGVLFDLNRMSDELGRSLDKLIKAQSGNGGFSWFPGFPEDRYMTQHIISGMGHLDILGIKAVRDDEVVWNMVNRALLYIDKQLTDDYLRLKAAAKRKEIKLEDNHLGYTQIHYLYTRSAFRDVSMTKESEEAFRYFIDQAKKYWLRDNIYLEGMICLALHRYNENQTAQKMMNSFRERALRSEEFGMYFKYNAGYYWYQAPVETQALMIEVFDEVANDAKAVDEMKVWLLRQKQTTDWRTTKATTEACYALIRRGTEILSNTRIVDIKIDNKIVDPQQRSDAKVEAGTGYFKTAWQASEITPAMGAIEVSKADPGIAWGAVYWQYFEQLDKITAAETPLKMTKNLFLQENSDRGTVLTPVTEKTRLMLGDLVKVRIEIRVDRNMEYVHLKDMRAAGFEPVSTLSAHKYQDGLYYYESPRDLATNFFMGYLPKGAYVFEYSLRVAQQGDFSNGVTTIQCMYAPEFSSHSAGIRVRIGDK